MTNSSENNHVATPEFVEPQSDSVLTPELPTVIGAQKDISYSMSALLEEGSKNPFSDKEVDQIIADADKTESDLPSIGVGDLLAEGSKNPFAPEEIDAILAKERDPQE